MISVLTKYAKPNTKNCIDCNENITAKAEGLMKHATVNIWRISNTGGLNIQVGLHMF